MKGGWPPCAANLAVFATLASVKKTVQWTVFNESPRNCVSKARAGFKRQPATPAANLAEGAAVFQNGKVGAFCFFPLVQFSDSKKSMSGLFSLPLCNARARRQSVLVLSMPP